MGRVLKGTVVVEATDDAGESIEDVVTAAYEQGRRDGEAAAVERLDAAMADLTAALSAAAGETATAVASAHRLDAETMVTLAADLASWYLGHGGADVDESVREAVHQAVVALEGEADLVVALNPDVAARLGSLPSVEVRSDRDLGPADFRLQAVDGAVERSWTDALDRLRPALVQALTRATRHG